MPRQPSCLCGSCPKCRKRIKAAQAYRDMSPEERKEWVARRDPEIVRKNDRLRHQRDRAKRNAANAAYGKAHPEAARKAKQAWNERNPEKRSAQVAVGNAVRDGRLVKGPCELADAECEGRVTAHHDDYSKPLEVRWLCWRHHAAVHTRPF